jgi:hypothetical protein
VGLDETGTGDPSPAFVEAAGGVSRAPSVVFGTDDDGTPASHLSPVGESGGEDGGSGGEKDLHPLIAKLRFQGGSAHSDTDRGSTCSGTPPLRPGSRHVAFMDEYKELYESPTMYVSTTCPPRVHHVSTMCPPCVYHVSTMCPPHSHVATATLRRPVHVAIANFILANIVLFYSAWFLRQAPFSEASPTTLTLYHHSIIAHTHAHAHAHLHTHTQHATRNTQHATCNTQHATHYHTLPNHAPCPRTAAPL